MALNNMSRIGIIGAGRLGSALAHALLAAGYPLEMISSRQLSDAERLVSSLPTVSSVTVDNLVQECDFVFLAVPDEYISELAFSLPWSSSQAVIHSSGSLNLDVLSVAKKKGSLTGCLHPVQTFLKRDSPLESRDRFANIVCGIEADSPLDIWLVELVESLGAYSIRLENVDRALYHSAAVFASNYVVALLSAATRIWTLSGLSEREGRMALQHIMNVSVNNLADSTFSDAVTGPITRGDWQTVKKHLSGLDSEPELQKLYSRLGLELLSASQIDLDVKIKITKLLESN
jgi:predicted short-subunit dehydrogenase-like oxidoreductase (DUF2520 family)